MGLFSTKKEQKVTPTTKTAHKEAVTKTIAKKVKANKAPKQYSADVLETVIESPRITEKAAYRAEKGVYVFNVTPRSNKTQIAQAILAIYNVKPVKVNITQITKKSVMLRGKRGTKGGGKKAYVYLKKGDSIEII